MTNPREGTVRRTVSSNPLFDDSSFNLEIFFRGEWTHFGSVGNVNSSNLEWQDAYRKLCHEVVDRFLEGQKS